MNNSSAKTKICKICGEVKSVDDFDTNYARCKVCRRQIHAKYQLDHREARNAACRKWYARHQKKAIRNSYEWKKKHPEQAKEQARKWWCGHRFQVALLSSKSEAKRMGHIPCTATVEEIKAAFTGFCSICGLAEKDCGRKLHMDHCHKTGKFRNWLCSRCNAALGQVGESADTLLRMIAYLDQHTNNNNKNNNVVDNR